MSNKDNFKEFVRKNPSLLKFVNKGEMTWQKFYEMYDLYGEENSVWDTYLKDDIKQTYDILNWFKKLDVDAVQENISSVKRVLSVLQELGKKEDIEASSYEPRPLYKHFED